MGQCQCQLHLWRCRQRHDPGRRRGRYARWRRRHQHCRLHQFGRGGHRQPEHRIRIGRRCPGRCLPQHPERRRIGQCRHDHRQQRGQQPQWRGRQRHAAGRAGRRHAERWRGHRHRRLQRFNHRGHRVPGWYTRRRRNGGRRSASVDRGGQRIGLQRQPDRFGRRRYAAWRRRQRHAGRRAGRRAARWRRGNRYGRLFGLHRGGYRLSRRGDPGFGRHRRRRCDPERRSADRQRLQRQPGWQRGQRYASGRQWQRHAAGRGGRRCP